jgi:alginate O-acetyltransferase complex protein AlgI
MVFNSFTFVIFFIVVVLLYYWLPLKKRNILLLIANYFFYMCWNAKYALLLLSVTIITYYSAILIKKCERYKKIVLILCLILNLGFLFCFKYLNFSINILNSILSLSGSNVTYSLWNIILPVGISFFIFQALGYVFDVYKKKVSVETNFSDFSLFVSFFPQLLSGPIGRADQLLIQFKIEHRFNYNNSRDGLQLIIWGLFQKIVIANRLAIYVDRVYNNLDCFSSYEIGFATLLFAIQIYCDFSGYSDMAVGLAKMLGFDLIRNFKRPYFSNSVGEFWHRWHISLSSWLRDYIYFPLGGSRVSKLRHKVNLMITFLVSGLWHGANWTYILWGGVHGVALVVESIKPFNSEKENVNKLHRFVIFIFVCFAWIFFRANSISDAFYVIKKLTIDVSALSLDNINKFVSGIDFVTFNNVVTHSIINSLTFVSLLIIIIIQFVFEDEFIDIYLNNKNRITRLTFNITIVMLILFCGVFDNTQFIYFQF